MFGPNERDGSYGQHFGRFKEVMAFFSDFNCIFVTVNLVLFLNNPENYDTHYY